MSDPRLGSGRPVSQGRRGREEAEGVWGEASPQVPREARPNVGRSRGASQPWVGRGLGRLFTSPGPSSRAGG